MCTITYLPTGRDTFILTSNRDESKIRPTYPPAIEDAGELKLLYPKDALAGGSWIGISSRNRIAGLMNGAFEKHEWKPPYRLSRGLVLLDLLKSNSLKTFIDDYPLSGIEPFTVIVYDAGSLTELSWDGLKKHIRQVDPEKAHIWSSASLYPKPVREKRERWFREWLNNHPQYNQEAILAFHRFGGEGDPENDFVMNRYDIVQTVSITSIMKLPDRAQMTYVDLITNQTSEVSIPIDREWHLTEAV
ncbi:MAG: hypothetical protein KatS3mg031_0048 [Chitinophagales bacterium]|nr:MAG: hypothetical protein KatS3mg031_0048 [Chitinophagales bacterium]